MTIRTALLTIGCLALVACTPRGTPPVASSSSSSSGGTPSQTSSPALVAEQVISALKAKDMTALARLSGYAGVRFTPFTHVDTQADIVLTQAELPNALSDATVRTWGIADGSGEPIELTFAAYFDKFVWGKDFTQAKDIRWDHVQDRGNTIDNAMNVYGGTRIVEFHVPGTEENGGMDWQSLRLIFAPNGNDWILVGIIHDQWTI